MADTRLYREGLAQILNERPGAVVVAALSSGDLSGAHNDTEFDVALVDISSPSGTLMIRRLREHRPEAKLVALAVRETADDVIRCAEAGVSAYVPSEASLEDLFAVITLAGRDQVTCPPHIAGALMRRVSALSDERRSAGNDAHLTAREREILKLIDHGLSNKQIAAQLQVRLSTVKNHVHNIFEKLGVHGRTAAAAHARGSSVEAVASQTI